MAHTLIATNHPNMLVMKIVGNLNYEDMTCDIQLGLNEHPRWIILDVSDMVIALPDGFLSGARRSWFTNPNTQHLALVAKSSFIKSVGLMVAKVTRRRDRLSVHETVEEAQNYILHEMNNHAAHVD